MLKKIFAVLVIAAGIFLWWGTRVSPGSIVIEKYGSIAGAAQKMSDAGIIRSPLLAKIFIRVFMSGATVYPGQVVVPAGCSWVCAMGKLMTASHVAVNITFPEGSDLRDIEKKIAAVDVDASKQLFSLSGAPAQYTTTDSSLQTEFPFLHQVPARVSYEGYLFPDTYQYAQAGGARGLMVQMLSAFDAKVNKPYAAEIAASGHTLHEVVTVASILEKEVRSPDDRAMVSDIIWRRLRAGMPLQLDSTVSYVHNDASVFTTSAERATASPWNTYAARGLPVGPICNPGVDAILAALHPRANPYWFYLAGSDGVVHYGKTLDDQIANKKYLK